MVSQRTPRPTMAQVAKLAGVSPTTVSMVINDDPRATSISAPTRDRVAEAIRTLGYQPNHAARGLRTQRSETLGFITDEIATTPFAGDTIRGAQEYAWKRNHLLTVLNTGGDPSMEKASIEMVLGRQVDGIIFGAMYTREVSPPRSLERTQAILLNCYAPGTDYISVIPAEKEGGRTATKILLAAGHRRIGFINGLGTTYAARERLKGYRRALREAGVSYEPKLVRHGTYQSDSGHRHARDLLTDDNPPTALFCSSDRMAVGAYYAIMELGLSIPGDVSVVGYDNQLELAAYASPPLTTIQLPHYEMGYAAAQYLLEGPPSNGQAGTVHEIDCPAVLRDSVGPPPN
jgi:LacI family transcriptional regulator